MEYLLTNYIKYTTHKKILNTLSMSLFYFFYNEVWVYCELQKSMGLI